MGAGTLLADRRSQQTADVVARAVGNVVYSVGTHPGGLTFRRADEWPNDDLFGQEFPDPPPTGWRVIHYRWDEFAFMTSADASPKNEHPDYVPPPRRLGGLGYERIDATVLTGGAAAVQVPFWFLAGATVGVTAVLLARRTRRFRQLRDGRCACCGYDLRASPGRCPACGATRVGAEP